MDASASVSRWTCAVMSGSTIGSTEGARVSDIFNW